MQASKIKIGEHYAVRIDGVLQSMQVTKVVTTRTGPHPSDFEHTITGKVGQQLYNYGPDHILGPYTEYAELVEQKQRANDEARRIAEAKTEAGMDVVRSFYQMCGIDPPNDLTNYNNPFYAARAGDISINHNGVNLLRQVFSKKES